MKFDLVVVGGGLSGIAASVAAARRGLSVLLCEKSGCLGGAIVNNLIFPYMCYTTKMDDGSKKYLSAGIFKEIMELGRNGFPGMNEQTFMSEYLKCRLDDYVLDNGVRLLLHADLCGVETSGERIVSARFATVSENLTVTADTFIDATGDGNLFALCGCDFTLGRENDSRCQPMTTCFRMTNVDMELFREQKSEIQRLYKELLAKGKLLNPREDVLTFTGLGENTVHFNTTRVILHNPTDPFEKSEAAIIARRQILEMVSFLCDNFTAFKNSTLAYVAVEIGVRESRKLKGEYILTELDLKNCTRFEDSIATGNYDIDIHSPDGSGTSHYYFKPGEYYTIPYRCLKPKEYENLLVAGRCVSATHQAQASIRIMPICCCLGEAAGTAAAIAKRTDTTVRTLPVNKLRSELREAGATID